MRTPPVLEERRFVAGRRHTIAMQVHGFLRREIIDARLLPRAPLSEQDLSTELGVSRTPVREALIKLADEGLVDIYPQFGTFVAPIKLREVYDSQFVREAIECTAIERAVVLIEKPQAAALQQILDTQRRHQKAGERDAFFEADERMHAYLLEIAEHATVWPLVQSAKSQMDRVRHLSIRSEVKLSSVLQEHSAIVDAVIRRDPKGALEALRAHLQGLFRSIKTLGEENKQYFALDNEGPPPRLARAKK
jgi:DNA-binding GntR family transcriptional regulator